MVAMAIIIGLMSIVIAVYPGYNNREQLFRATDLVKNHLARARQWAIRDNVSTGIQFGSKSGGLGTTLTFVQGMPLIPGSPNLELNGPTGNTATVSNGKGVLFTNPNPLTTDPYYVWSKGKAFQVTGVSGDTITFDRSPAFPSNFQDFLLIRSAQPLTGEPVIELFPDKPTIRTTLSTTKSTIIFNNKGQVSDVSSGQITIHVEQTEPDETQANGFKVVEESFIYLDVISGLTRVK